MCGVLLCVLSAMVKSMVALRVDYDPMAGTDRAGIGTHPETRRAGYSSTRAGSIFVVIIIKLMIIIIIKYEIVGVIRQKMVRLYCLMIFVFRYSEGVILFWTKL